ncbi:MAG: hypothetical protein QGI43_01975 [Gemmatimonadota bacterium]|nr:hypothetical protein [Gemmatimonadota bacterium]
MSFLDRFPHRRAVPSSLRPRLGAAFDADDEVAISRMLDENRAGGKALILELKDEIATLEEGSPGREEARRLMMNLVVIYTEKFCDPEPLAWFRKEGVRLELDIARVRLGDAQEHYNAEDPQSALTLAFRGLNVLLNAQETPEVFALRSGLLLVAVGVAMTQENYGQARQAMEASLEAARKGEDGRVLADALLASVDLANLGNAHADATALLDEVCEVCQNQEPHRDRLIGHLVRRGVDLLLREDLAGSRDSLTRAIDLRPEWPFGWYQRAWTRFLQEDDEGALADYRECAARQAVFFTVQREIRCLQEVADGDLPAEVYRAFCALREQSTSKPDAVLRATKKMLSVAPAFAPAQLLFAEAQLASGDPESGREATAATLRIDPDPDTAAAALFMEWNLARGLKDAPAQQAAADRLASAYPRHPQTALIEAARKTPGEDILFRWTYGLDGSLRIDSGKPTGHAQ